MSHPRRAAPAPPVLPFPASPTPAACPRGANAANIDTPPSRNASRQPNFARVSASSFRSAPRTRIAPAPEVKEEEQRGGREEPINENQVEERDSAGKS